MDVLCEHAHSDSPALRLNALWGLKHFVDACGPDLKKKCLERVGTERLLQMVWDGGQDQMLYSSQGERPLGENMDQETVTSPGSEEAHQWLYRSNGRVYELDASKSTRLRRAEDKLSSVREAELDPVRKARNDDIATQEQAFDFIRNLIGRPGHTSPNADSPSETTEMLDHLFEQLGREKLFEILASKLRPRMLGRFSQRGRETRMVHPHAKIMGTVIFILVHMAASVTTHRSLIISQTDLLKALCQQATNKDRDVRVALCHLVINLTCQDEEGETLKCQERALELKKLGFLHKMDSLRNSDRDLDVRERAKTAAWQIEQATY